MEFPISLIPPLFRNEIEDDSKTTDNSCSVDETSNIENLSDQNDQEVLVVTDEDQTQDERTYTIKELKNKCKDAGLSTAGTKKELFKRLTEKGSV